MSNTDADTGRLPVAKTYKLYIGGKFPRTESGRANALRNSAGDVIANVCRASRKDLRSAVVAARAATPEPTGVGGIVAPSAPGLLGLVSMLAPVIAGGNCVVALAPERHPLSSMSFAEVLHASDVPAGVVNLLTRQVEELLPHLAKHKDVNGLLIADATAEQADEAQRDGAENIKRVIDVTGVDWSAADAEGVYHIASMQETKTTWHPIAN